MEENEFIGFLQDSVKRQRKIEFENSDRFSLGRLISQLEKCVGASEKSVFEFKFGDNKSVCLTLNNDEWSVFSSICNGPFSSGIAFLRTLKHVHELENLYFFLSGKELELDLTKIKL